VPVARRDSSQDAKLLALGQDSVVSHSQNTGPVRYELV
jgi:hypothetical protein